MNAYEAYNCYLAMKFHFTRDSYDYFKYNGRTNASVDAFERRKDKYFFHKLAKMPEKDVKDLILANIIYDDKHRWVGDLLTDAARDRLLTLRQRQQSITYHFQNSLGVLDEDFGANFKVSDGDHPKLIALLRRDEISLEAATILCSVTNCIQTWDNKIEDTIVWPTIRRKIVKYTPFVTYDKQKIKDVLLKKFS